MREILANFQDSASGIVHSLDIVISAEICPKCKREHHLYKSVNVHCLLLWHCAENENPPSDVQKHTRLFKMIRVNRNLRISTLLWEFSFMLKFIRYIVLVKPRVFHEYITKSLVTMALWATKRAPIADEKHLRGFAGKLENHALQDQTQNNACQELLGSGGKVG